MLALKVAEDNLIRRLILCSDLTYEAFRGAVVEYSAPNVGTGYNGPVENATVITDGSLDGPMSFTTDAMGNFWGIFSPESTPVAYASKYGVSTSGGPNSLLVLNTDSTFKVGLAAGSSPDADGSAFHLAASANGQPISLFGTTLGLPDSYPSLVTVPRSACGDGPCHSTLDITGLYSARFTWIGEDPISYSDTALTGQPSNATIQIPVMHKWVEFRLTFTTNGLPVPNDLEVSVYDPSAVSYPAESPAVYDASGLFGLPATVDASGTPTSHTNPSIQGPAVSVYVWTAARLGTADAPYKPTFKIHVENKQLISDVSGTNEDFTITDADRISGVHLQNMVLVTKEQPK